MSSHEKLSREERLERWLDKKPERKPRISLGRARRMHECFGKVMHWTRAVTYVIALLPLLAALRQYASPTALVEVKGGVSGRGVPNGTTPQQIYVSLDDPSVGQRLSMASPWLVLALLLIGVVWSLRYIERKVERSEGNPFPGTAVVALVITEVAFAFGMWLFAFTGLLSRGSVGEPGVTDAEWVLAVVLTLIVVTMCVTTGALQMRGNEDHKKLEDIV